MWVGVYFHGNTVLFSAHFGMLVKNLLIMNLVFYSVPSGLVIIISQNSSKSMEPEPSSSSSSRMPSTSSSWSPYPGPQRGRWHKVDRILLFQSRPTRPRRSPQGGTSAPLQLVGIPSPS